VLNRKREQNKNQTRSSMHKMSELNRHSQVTVLNPMNYFTSINEHTCIFFLMSSSPLVGSALRGFSIRYHHSPAPCERLSGKWFLEVAGRRTYHFD
jgi:hypothetical protein